MKSVIALFLTGIILAGSASLKADEVKEWNMAVLDMIKADGISISLATGLQRCSILPCSMQ